MKRNIIVISLVALVVAVWGCDDGSEVDPTSNDGVHPIPGLADGKADNYISTNAREFLLTGTSTVSLPEGFAGLEPDAQATEIDRVAQSRLSSVSRSIRSHLDEVIRQSNGGVSGEDADYFTYFRRNSTDLEAVEATTDGKARVSFEIELVGSTKLMSLVAPEGRSRRTFEVTVKEWPDPDGEVITVEIKGSASRDAFPKYNELFADGIYDIAVHFGGDYNQERFDIDTAKWVTEYLLEGGWTNEGVTKFEELTIDSPPFTRKITVEGREVEARVYLYHSDMVEGADEIRLTEVMRDSFKSRDVVIYSGHAGEGAGFILDYQPRHEISASAFAELPMAEKYQIFVFDGCRTYRTYVDDIMKNPAKTFDNVDIVTTVNTTPFAVGYQLIHEFLYWLTFTNQEGSHFPLSWATILRGLNTEKYDSVHYGVHGVDHDPQLNPHASEGIACSPCSSDADCGAGGNFCLGFTGGAACGVACTTDTACPDGQRCARLWDDPDLWYLPKQCVPRNYVCE